MTDQRAPGDHFSGVSAGYAAFRPQYSQALFEFLATIAPRRGRVWDCGTGTGQAAVDLAEWFDEVIATDVSAEQIAQAPSNPRRHVDEGYRTIPFPFPKIAAPTLNLVEHWSREQLAGYLRTWSATTRYRAAEGHDPVEQFERDLERTWPDASPKLLVEWPLIVVAGRVDLRLSR